MSTRYRVICGVPEQFCTGGHLVSDQKLGTSKAHASHEDAFNCMAKYLVSQGFERLGAREFKDPQTGYVRVLQKKIRYGGLLVSGKTTKGAKGGSRFMPEKKRVGNRGTIV
jgi:hypothetical protein